MPFKQQRKKQEHTQTYKLHTEPHTQRMVNSKGKQKHL